jgi:hypothetical protein
VKFKIIIVFYGRELFVSLKMLKLMKLQCMEGQAEQVIILK